MLVLHSATPHHQRLEWKKVKYALTDMGVQILAPGTYFDTKTPAFGIRVGKHSRTLSCCRFDGQAVRLT